MNNSQVALNASQDVKIHLHTECGEVKPRFHHVLKMGVKTTKANDPPNNAEQLSGQLVVRDEVRRAVCHAGGLLSRSLETKKEDKEAEREEDEAVDGAEREKHYYNRGVHTVHNMLIHAGR